MTAREKFKIGDRVVLSEKGRRQEVSPVTSGVVTGFGPSSHLVRVHRDGRSEIASFHFSFWDRADAQAVSP